MPPSRTSSNASPTCRVELGPSRLEAFALAVIGILGGAGLFLTDLPVPVAASVAPAVAGWGLLLSRRVRHRKAVQVAFRGDGCVQIDAADVEDVRMEWRGPLTCLQWREDGRRVRLVAWPDVIDARARRELRLWALAHRADAAPAPVAP